MVLLYGVLPDWFLIPTSNTLFIGSFVALQVGVLRFLGRAVSPARRVLLLMLFWMTNFIFTLLWSNPGVRISTIGVGTILICIQGFFTWRTAEAETRRLMRVLVWVGVGFSLISVIRIVFVVLLASEKGVSHLATAEAIALLLYQICFIALTFVLSFVVNLRISLARDTQELALRASEEQFRTLFETIPQGVLYLDAEGYVRQANPAARSILELDQEGLLGCASVNPRWCTVHEDGSDFPPAEHPALVALRTGEPVLDCTMGVFNPLVETWRWIVVNAVPQFQPGKARPYQVYVTLTDITERKAKEAALRASEERYRKLVELSPDGIGILDRRGRFVTGNERFGWMHGCARGEELVGQSIRDFVTPQELSKLLGTVLPILQSGAAAHGVEAETHLRDGSSMIAEYSAASIAWSEAPDDEAYIVSVRDVTERRQLLDALQVAREHLEARVQERTYTLEAEIGKRKAAEATAVKRALELATRHTLSRAVSVNLAPETVIDAALDGSIALPGVDLVLLFLRRDDQVLELVGQRVKQLPWQMDAAEGARLAAGLGAAGVLEGAPLYCGDTVNALQCPFTTDPELHSLIALPLHSGATVIGVLVLGATGVDAFAEQRAFLETVADHVAVGLQNALRYQEIGERSAGLEELVAERTFELRTARDRTQAILEALGEAVTVTDMEGQVLFANPAKFSLLGCPEEELLGRPLWQWWSSLSPAETWSTIQRSLRSAGMWQGEITLRNQDGGAVILATTGTLLRHAGVAAADVGIVWVQSPHSRRRELPTS
ncbi:MAG: Sensor histidine kinase TmoS [Chloroflexi bacterium ADurb.Bin360]|nr:MAG: Sensor histidine kinase TmoS [Chloroflexi bacterium ADurb.Bin360]